MLIVLEAPCLSEHICNNADFFSCLCFSSPLSCCLILIRLFQHHAAYGEAYQAKSSRTPSHQSQSKVWIMCLCCPHNCLISPEYNRVTKCLELLFYYFYWLGLQTFGVFWIVHKSKRLAPASFPLGARRRGNLLKLHAFVVTSCFNGVRLTGTPSLRQIILVVSLALLWFFIYIPLTGPRQRKSVQY